MHFLISTLCIKVYSPHPLPVPPAYPSYLWGAVWCGGAAVEVILGQKEGRVGHVQDGVVHQHHLAEVELVGETFPFGFVQNAFVVVIPAKDEGSMLKQGWSEGIRDKGKGKRKRKRGEED